MLTTQQLAALKADILADPVLSAQPMNSDGSFAIAAAYNLEADPAFVVWRTNVPAQEIMSNGFVWTSVDALTAGKARIWDWMTRYGSINPSKANVRQGLQDCFGAASAMVTGILPHLKRNATRGERLLATGTGTNGTPGVLTFEGTLSYQDIEAARNS